MTAHTLRAIVHEEPIGPVIHFLRCHYMTRDGVSLLFYTRPSMLVSPVAPGVEAAIKENLKEMGTDARWLLNLAPHSRA